MGSAVDPSVSKGMFWRLLLGTVLMLAFGYAGEAQFIPAMAGFVVGMCGWAFILFEVFAGEAGKVAADGSKVNKYVMESYSTMRLIVSVGWSIYPLGHLAISREQYCGGWLWPQRGTFGVKRMDVCLTMCMCVFIQFFCFF